MTLLFPGLIMSILHNKKVKFLSSCVPMKWEDPISAQTMTRSEVHLQGYEEELAKERPNREATEAKGGDTDEEIDRLTLGPKDIPTLPPQDQP